MLKPVISRSQSSLCALISLVQPVGTFGNSSGCFPCLLGTYNNALHAKRCSPCKPGTSANREGQAHCFVCGDGNVASNYGMVGCIACPSNGFANFEHTACICSPGYYLPGYNFDSIFTCIPCPLGADCTNSGNTYYNLQSEAGWWRSSNSSLNFYRCPIRSQCIGSLPQGGSAVYDGSDLVQPVPAGQSFGFQTMSSALGRGSVRCTLLPVRDPVPVEPCCCIVHSVSPELS
jgi:hypothetical protein